MPDLTPRQLEVLRLAAADYTMTETARRLCVSYETVRSHRKAILERLGCRTIAGAVGKLLMPESWKPWPRT
jgi:DNA-binding CsgD family transcriptional regulator